MKKLVIAGLFVAIAAFCASTVFASSLKNAKFYLEAEAGATFANLDSSGYNIAGGFDNAGDDSVTTVVPGIHAGVQLLDYLRADVGFNYRGNLPFTTNSFIPSDPTYFYKTNVDYADTVMFSLYLEPIHYKKFTPYIGAGFGAALIKTGTDDTVVFGRERTVNFAWQAEAGIQRELTQHLTLRLGYRYVDMGNLKTALIAYSDGTDAGEFKGDLIAHEATVGLRYTF